MIRKRGLFRKKPLEDITHKNMVWMPYHRIQFTFRRSKEDLVQRHGETALNAMFCESVKSERELFILFRPNYLKHKTTSHSPQSGEIVGSTFRIDFDRVLEDILERLNRAKEELRELRSELQKIRARIRRYGHIVPMIGALRREKELSEKVAKLSAMRNVLSMCLNINEDIRSVEVVDHDTFYYPTLAVTLRSKEDGSERYLIVDLASGLIGKHLNCDRELTELCEKNSVCKEIIARSLRSDASHVQ